MKPDAAIAPGCNRNTQSDKFLGLLTQRAIGFGGLAHDAKAPHRFGYFIRKRGKVGLGFGHEIFPVHSLDPLV